MTIVRLLAQKDRDIREKKSFRLQKCLMAGAFCYIKITEVSDFITSYVKYDYPKREVYFRLTDFYSKFYLSFIDGRKTTNPHFWQKTTC